MKLNYIDLFMLVIAAIFIFAGFIGRGRKKLAHLIGALAAVITAYFTFGYVADILINLSIDSVPLTNIIESKVAALAESNEVFANIESAIQPMIGSIGRFFIFWIEAIVLVIIYRFIISFIMLFIKKKKHYLRASKTLGIPGFIKSILLFNLYILPLLFICPLAKNVEELSTLVPVLADKPAVLVISEQLQASKYLQLSDMFFNWDKNKLVCYEVDGEQRNVYKELTGLSNLSKAMPLLEAFQEGKNPIQALKELSKEDLCVVLSAIDENKDLIATLIPEDAELPINIADINFKEEAPAIEVFLDIVSFDSQGEMNFNIDNIDNTKVADAIVNSEMLNSILQPGMLADLPEENKTAIMEQVQNKQVSGDISEMEYDKIAAYFVKSNN